jgi:hypothetical protein
MIHHTVESPSLARVNFEPVLAMNNHGESNFIFLTAVVKSALDNMRLWV